MNVRKILIFYLISLPSFIVSTFFYAPRPKLNQFLTHFGKNDQLDVREVYLDEGNLSNRIKRRINIGNSYRIKIDDEISMNITHLAFWNKENFNLSNYSKYLPELIIDTDEIIFLKVNNYGTKKTSLGREYQACVFNSGSPSFLYKFDSDEIVYRYNNFNHWIWVIKKEILNVFGNFQQRNFNCLLITTNNPEIFVNDKKNLLKRITKNF